VCFISETGPIIKIFRLLSIFIFKLPSLNLISILFSVSCFIDDATAVAQAAVPHAFVNPAPRSQTFTVILFLSSICAKVTLTFSGIVHDFQFWVLIF